MPYSIKKVDGGSKVVSPNHPAGFSKKPQSKQQAIKQMVAIKINSGEDSSGKKTVSGDSSKRRIGVKKKG